MAEARPINNIISGRSLVDAEVGVLSLLKWPTSEGEQAVFILETLINQNLHLQIISLKPKEKSQYASVEIKSSTYAGLNAIINNKIIYQSWELTLYQIAEFLQEINTQQTYHILYEKNNTLEYKCRSWQNPEQVYSHLAWFEMCLNVLEIKVKLNAYQPLKLNQANANKIIVPLVNSNANLTLFAKLAAKISPDNLYQKGKKYLSNKKYADALKVFEQALQLDSNHVASREGKRSALFELGVAAYNSNDFSNAANYFQQILTFIVDDRMASDCLALAQNKLQPQLEIDAAAKLRFPYRIENLVFQGGGIKGIAYIGALKKMQTYCEFNLAQIKRVVGTSAGAITALGLGLGYSIAEIEAILTTTNFSQFLQGDYRESFLHLTARQEIITEKIKKIREGGVVSGASKAASAYASDADIAAIKQGFDLLKQDDFGLFSTDSFRQWAEELIRLKTGGIRQADGSIMGGLENATFKELHDLSINNSHQYPHLKEIFFVTVNLTLNKIEVFSHHYMPDVIVSDAMCASMCIPLVFKAKKLFIKNAASGFKPVPDPRNHLHVDGGLLSNVAPWVLDHSDYLPKALRDGYQINPHTLVLSLTTSDHYYQSKAIKPMPDGLISYVKQLIECIFENRERHIPGTEYRERVITIDSKGVKTTEFDLNSLKRDLLLASGAQGVVDYFKKIAPETLAYFSSKTIAPAYFVYINPQQKDAGGNNPLHTAVKSADLALINYLLENHANKIDKNAANDVNQTVWDLANSLQHPLQAQILAVLKQYNFEPVLLAVVLN